MTLAQLFYFWMYAGKPKSEIGTYIKSISVLVCDTQFTLILFFLSFFELMFNLRGPQGQNTRTACGPRTTV
jgi:hypothetical protein